MLLRSGRDVEYRPVPSRRSWRSVLAVGFQASDSLVMSAAVEDGGVAVPDGELQVVDLNEDHGDLPPIVPIEEFELEPVAEPIPREKSYWWWSVIVGVFAVLLMMVFIVFVYWVLAGSFVCFVCCLKMLFRL